MFFNQDDRLNIQNLRSAFRRLCLLLHPDKGGDRIEFGEMKKEYDNLIKGACSVEGERARATGKRAAYTYEGEKAFMEKVQDFLNIAGVTVEICGSWLWLSGKTFISKDRIKALGAKWSTSKKRWFWSCYMSANKPRRSMYRSMAEVRNAYGSEVLVSEAEEQAQVVA
jgi:hypothetical protein